MHLHRETLRFLIDAVGMDRVVLGTDYPAPMVQEDPVGWLKKMPSVSEGERTAILATNPARNARAVAQGCWLDTEITSPVR